MTHGDEAARLAATNSGSASAHTASVALHLIAWAVLIPGSVIWVLALAVPWLLSVSPTQCAFFGVLAICVPLVTLSEVRVTSATRWSLLLQQALPAAAMVACLAMMGVAGRLLFPEYPAAGPHEYLLISMPALSVLAAVVTLTQHAAPLRRLLRHGMVGGLMLWGSYSGTSVPLRESLPLRAYPIKSSQGAEFDLAMRVSYVQAKLNRAQQADYVERLQLSPIAVPAYGERSIPTYYEPPWWHPSHADRVFFRDERGASENGCQTLVAIEGETVSGATSCYSR